MDLRTYQRQKSKDALKRKAIIAFSVVFFLWLMIWGSFWLPWLRISQISSDDFVSKGEIESAVSPYMASLNSFFLPNNNFFLLRTSELENILKEKGAGIAEVKKLFPQTLDIKFPQTEPWLIFCLSSEALAKDSGQCFYVSKSGVLEDYAPQFSEKPLPEIMAGGQNGKLGDGVISAEEAAFLRVVFKNLKILDIYPSEVSFKKDEVKVLMKEDWYLLIPKNMFADKIFADLKLLMEQKIKEDRAKLEYIDMRYENKAFYKLK